MSKITESARGQQCQVRISGICNFNPETTVFAHYRNLSLGCGTGLKPIDLFGTYACSRCHDFIDGRIGNKNITTTVDFLIGVLRTQKILLDSGLIKI